MKNLFVLLMAFSFFVVSCNNNKNDKNQNLNNRDKDDYGKNENLNTDNADKTNVNTGNTGWSGNDKNRFLKECIVSFDESQSELANKICPCVLEKMEKEFASYNEANTKGGEAASTRIALQCKEEIAGNSDNNNNTVSSWSSRDINEFVSNCVSTAVQGGMSQDLAQRYCSCMQQKFEQMFPDPKDAGSITEEQMNTPSMTAMAKRCLNGNYRFG